MNMEITGSIPAILKDGSTRTLKVGDRVKLTDLKTAKEIDDTAPVKVSIVSDMEPHFGTIVTISKLLKHGNYNSEILFRAKGSNWAYNTRFIEKTMDGELNEFGDYW